VTEGPSRAPHRSYLYAMGLTTQQIHQPFVGVCVVLERKPPPCNISLMRQAQAVKKGRRFRWRARRANSAPSRSPTASPWAMPACSPHCRPRECIADSVELTMRGHAYDALVGLAGLRQVVAGA